MSCDCIGHVKQLVFIPIYFVSGRSAQQAVEEGLSYMQERVRGSGGAIALTSRGDIGISFLSEGMSWAYVSGPQIHYGIYKGEDKSTFL